VKHFLMTASTAKEILQGELRLRKFSRRWVPHSLNDPRKFARVDAAKEMLRILQESETNDFDDIARHDEPLVSTYNGILENVYPFGSKCHSEDATSSWHETNHDYGVLHRKETYRARCSSKV
jgi:hypothetical protein